MLSIVRWYIEYGFTFPLSQNSTKMTKGFGFLGMNPQGEQRTKERGGKWKRLKILDLGI